MIKNERQYRFTKAQVRGFERTLAELRNRDQADIDVHPLIAKAQEDAVNGQLVDLRDELQAYESLKAGKFEVKRLDMVSDLPTMLISARIAQGMAQKDLAERVGLKEQQIQRYESEDYAKASLARIREIARGLRVKSSV